jgi:signal transduction histidine kinase
MFRNKPDGDWRQCSIQKMGQRIQEMRGTLAYIAEKTEGTEVSDMAKSHL